MSVACIEPQFSLCYLAAMSKRARIGFWTLITVLIALTRISASAEYFSIDNVNLALALEKFDPNNHQPQPPGYPFFVASGRLVNFFFHDARLTFLAVSLLVTGLCLLVIVALGSDYSRNAQAKPQHYCCCSIPFSGRAGLMDRSA